MTVDDLFAELASRPRRERPIDLRSDSAMLQVWIRLRADRAFCADLLLHNIDKVSHLTEASEHAISNVWGIAAMEAVRIKM